MIDIVSKYLDVTDSFQVKILTALILVHVILCACLAVKNKKFQLILFNNDIDKSLVLLYGGLSVVGLVACVQPGWSVMLSSMWGILDLAMAGLIALKLQALGLPIPSIPWINK